ncbi:oligosaccharide flippase family protein [Paenibacillus sp. BSR1-1]|uniref:oligosaccharide flippase family protein n=1 Tax=Paenibacillus sp. BSR1-1 TaxID=3020845 RepID=UPI0025B172C6|nr:oligosaccharide flippase family protein [Paenibacillus sp. BSR1-1]MDN3019004.1 oligosaccharide flippase family protein [Paenibacillus sp. BSR1-1]
MQKTSLIKNIIYKMLLNVFNIVIPILVGPYVYRTLGATSIGKVQLSETIFNYFFIFAVFGVYNYGLREMSRIKTDQKKVNQFFTSMLTISIGTSILSLIVYLVFCYIGYSDRAIFPVLMIYAVNLIGNIFYVEWVNEASEKYNFITLKTILIKIVYISLLFTLVKTSHDYKTYAFLLILTTFLNNIVSFIYIKRKIKLDFSNISIKKHIKPLLLVVFFSNANILYNQLDRFMLGSFINEATVSYYVMAQQIMGIINTLMLSIIQVTIPRLSYLTGNEDEDSYVKLLNNISKVYFAFLFPASIGLFVTADAGILLYGGHKYISAQTPLKIFAIYMISVGIESILSNQVIYVKKRENILVRLVFICGILNLIFNISLIQLKIFNPTTAILTTAISNFLLLGMEYIFIKKYLKVNFSIFSITKIKYFFYSLIFIPIHYLLQMVISHYIPLFLVTVIVCIGVYVAILFLTKDEVLFMFLNKIKGRFGRPAKS